MIAVPNEWLLWADFLAKLGQFFFGAVTLTLAVWAATFKRKDLLRSELSKKQLDELARVRNALQAIFFDLYYIPSIYESMRTMRWTFETLKENDPDSWEQYVRYKNTSLDLFYKFSDEQYYLFPRWVEARARKRFAEAMRKFAPFTLIATTSKTPDEQRAYADEILWMKNYLDSALQQRA